MQTHTIFESITTVLIRTLPKISWKAWWRHCGFALQGFNRRWQKCGNVNRKPTDMLLKDYGIMIFTKHYMNKYILFIIYQWFHKLSTAFLGFSLFYTVHAFVLFWDTFIRIINIFRCFFFFYLYFENVISIYANFFLL